MLKVFLCHADSENELALKIKDYFEDYFGLDCFVAPQSIPVSEDFIYQIKWQIRKSSFIIPLISKSFHKSLFANQEIGYSIAHEKDIIPISIEEGEHPEGLILNVQDLNGTDETKIFETISTIFSMIIKFPQFWIWRSEAKEGIVEALCGSDNFKKTSILIPLIINTDRESHFEKPLLEKMYNASKINDQVYSYYYFSKLKEFLISKGFSYK